MNNEKFSRLKLNFNSEWKFILNDVAGAEHLGFEDLYWENVILPHTPKIEAVDVCRHFQGICWYRKHFTIDSLYEGKKIFIEFEAAMQVADIWINGKHKLTHLGGYLPFTIDISNDVLYGEDNVISVRLDNRDKADIPPGRPLERLDFSYFGGIYRNVFMHVTDKLHVTDAVYENKVAGGGVFITYSDVSEKSAKIHIKTNIKNEYNVKKETRVITYILDAEGAILKKDDSISYEILPGCDYTFTECITLDMPKLWHPDSPYLYTVYTHVFDGELLVDEVKVKVGIRSISCKKPDGFMINGKPLKINGVNHHHQYPYIGIAASDNAQYRDAKKLKEAGFNYIRLSHYPHSPAFLEACDELGLMVVEPTPGWQWCREGLFQEIVIQNIRDMVRRDRNHPCVVMWEVSLNETGTYWKGADDDFFHKCHEAAHEEYPGDQMLTSGDTIGRKDPKYVGFDVPYTEWDEDHKSRPLNSLPDKMGLDREYGDFEFGGHYSTTRAFRRDGEKAMLQQAWNFQWSLNRNLGNPWSIGGAIWVGIDYNRGCALDKPICNCGILDTFRIPKFAYHFYSSQKNPVIDGPVVYIANYWTPLEKKKKVVVYSNCDEVKLYLNERLLEIKKPDNGPDIDFAAQNVNSTVDYWLENKDIPGDAGAKLENEPLAKLVYENCYTGGNCRRLDHAPFTFQEIAYEYGELKAVGIIRGEEVAIHTRKTPGNPCTVAVKFDTCERELKADSSDFVFVYAEVIDENGTVIPNAENIINFTVSGPASLIGDNPVSAESGIASIILKSQAQAGKIVVTAESSGLKSGYGEIISNK
jgi:beta-galactosidase